MAKGAVGPGGGETSVMVDRGVEVGHGAGDIALLAPHHAHAVVRSGPTGAHGAGAIEVVDGEVGLAEGALAVGTLQVDAAVARVARKGGRELGHRAMVVAGGSAGEAEVNAVGAIHGERTSGVQGKGVAGGVELGGS